MENPLTSILATYNGYWFHAFMNDKLFAINVILEGDDIIATAMDLNFQYSIKAKQKDKPIFIQLLKENKNVFSIRNDKDGIIIYYLGGGLFLPLVSAIPTTAHTFDLEIQDEPYHISASLDDHTISIKMTHSITKMQYIAIMEPDKEIATIKIPACDIYQLLTDALVISKYLRWTVYDDKILLEITHTCPFTQQIYCTFTIIPLTIQERMESMMADLRIHLEE